MKKPKEIPFPFVFEKLSRLDPVTRPMFGCHAIYAGEKILLVVRKKEAGDPDNGVWLATSREHHASLRRDLPGLRDIRLFGDNGSGWQILPEEDEGFEEKVIVACELILKNDPRIGKIPKGKKKKSA